MATMAMTRILHFAAAHRLRSPALSDDANRALYGQCYRGHGHNYALEVTVRGPVGADGMVMDLDELDRVMRRTVIDLVDHHDLDEDVAALRGVVSSGENLAVTFYRLLEPALPPGRLHRVAVVETENNRFEHGPGTGHGDRA